jgi:hypothetical protein
VAVLPAVFPHEAQAQQTIFNIPSPDVLEPGAHYFETDHYFRTRRSGSDSPGFFFVRGVFGIGSNAEAGFNVGPQEFHHASQPFIDATIKWRPFRREFGKSAARGALGLLLGDNAGIGLRNETAGQARNFAYMAGFVEAPLAGTRVSAGTYFATREVFTDRRRFGAQATFEQPIPGVKGLVFATDWFSGDGAYATSGLIWTAGRFITYAGYGFANKGKNDLVTLEIGIKF